MGRFGRTPTYLGFGALLALGANQYATKRAKDHEDSIAVYKIGWQRPAGWKDLPHSAQSLFLFRDPKTQLLVRGASNQVIADENPTPDMDSDGMAKYYLETTAENMAEWSGEKMPGEDGDGVPFALIRRKRDGKTVISAFGVRGNTTMVVTLSGNGKEQAALADKEAVFRDLLHHISFRKGDYAMR